MGRYPHPVKFFGFWSDWSDLMDAIEKAVPRMIEEGDLARFEPDVAFSKENGAPDEFTAADFARGLTDYVDCTTHALNEEFGVVFVTYNYAIGGCMFIATVESLEGDFAWLDVPDPYTGDLSPEERLEAFCKTWGLPVKKPSLQTTTVTI